jgi:hypothetical protein
MILEVHGLASSGSAKSSHLTSRGVLLDRSLDIRCFFHRSQNSSLSLIMVINLNLIDFKRRLEMNGLL